MSELVNLEVEFLKGGYDKYATKYDETGKTKFAVGRRVDWKNKDHEAEGNFEVAIPEKGKSRDDWSWHVTPYDRNGFVQTFSYLVKTEDFEGWVDLSWTSNEQVKKLADKNQYGDLEFPFKVKVKRPDKAYEFHALASAKDFENMEPAGASLPESDLPF